MEKHLSVPLTLLLLSCLILPQTSLAYSISKQVGQFDYYTLALSWQPAFCELKPRKSECRSQNKAQFSAYHFVLHGLWPGVKGDKRHQYGYCNVSKHILKNKKRWCAMPQLDLSKPVRKRLTQFMPGSQSSCLQRHEWYKHGVCSGLSENNYFALSNQLVDMFSKTGFSQKITQNVGKYVKRKNVLKAFDKAFGKGSRKHLGLMCKKVRGTPLLTEIQIRLKTDLSDMSDFKHLFPKQEIRIYGTCPSQFKIDEVGILGENR